MLTSNSVKILFEQQSRGFLHIFLILYAPVVIVIIVKECINLHVCIWPLYSLF